MCVFATMFLSYNLFPCAICVKCYNSASQLVFLSGPFGEDMEFWNNRYCSPPKKRKFDSCLVSRRVHPECRAAEGCWWTALAQTGQRIGKALKCSPPSTGTCTCLPVSLRSYLRWAVECNSARGCKIVLEMLRGFSSEVGSSFPCFWLFFETTCNLETGSTDDIPEREGRYGFMVGQKGCCLLMEVLCGAVRGTEAACGNSSSSNS